MTPLHAFGISTLAFTFQGLVIGSMVYSLPFAVQPIRGGFEAFQHIRYALFEMREGGRAVIADLHMVEAVHQRPQGAFDMFRIVADHGPFAAFQRRCQCRDALFEDRE